VPGGRDLQSAENPDVDEGDVREFLDSDYRRIVMGVALVAESVELAEDAVQEALARAWERSERGERIESLPGWVRIVAINLVRSGIRRRIRERRVRARLAEPPVSEPLIRSDDLVDVRRALAQLSPRQRLVTVLRYYFDLSLGEIATMLKINEGTVKTNLFRARQAMGRHLGDEKGAGT